MLRFSTEHLNRVFDSEEKYEAVKNLMFDVAKGREVYDEAEDRVIRPAEANDKIRKVVFEVLGLDEKSTRRDRRRAMRKHGAELFEVIEDIIDGEITTGFKESEFFNEFVDNRNIALGDSQEFWTEDNTILSVAKVSGDHHDLILQRLGSGESYTVPVSTYAVAVGADIDKYLVGDVDWAKMIQKVAEAFVQKIQEEIYSQVMNAGSSIPSSSQFVKSGQLVAANKTTFDTLIEDVSAANGGSEVYILGTKTALKKITALADVNWADDATKAAYNAFGRLGSYEGTTLIEIPQRFKPGDTTQKLVDNTKLLVMPRLENKFVKFVDVGEAEVLEITEKGERMDDTMKYEVQRDMGVGVKIGRIFGMWTITQ